MQLGDSWEQLTLPRYNVPSPPRRSNLRHGRRGAPASGHRTRPMTRRHFDEGWHDLMRASRDKDPPIRQQRWAAAPKSPRPESFSGPGFVARCCDRRAPRRLLASFRGIPRGGADARASSSVVLRSPRLATTPPLSRRATRSETSKHPGMREPHPARRLVLLARCRPSQKRFRTRPGHSLTGTERVFSFQRALIANLPRATRPGAAVPPAPRRRGLPGSRVGSSPRGPLGDK